MLGADVLKIEDPKGGDVMRTRAAGDPKLGEDRDGDGLPVAEREQALDHTEPSASRRAAVFRDLAAKSDVVVENLRTGTMARYGLAYEDLRSLNPRLVYCSLTGYGHTGPKARHPAYDPVIQASSGVMGLTALGDSGPVKAGIPAIDYGTGMMAASASSLRFMNGRRPGSGSSWTFPCSTLPWR